MSKAKKRLKKLQKIRQLNRRLVKISLIVAVVVIVVAVLSTVFVTQVTNTSAKLASALANTTKQKALEFDVTIDLPEYKGQSAGHVEITNGKYSQNQGLAVDSVGKFDNASGSIEYDTKWYVDSKGDLYYNLVNTKIALNDEAQKIADQYKLTGQDISDMMNANGNRWIKPQADLPAAQMPTGFSSCVLTETYKMLSSKSHLKNFINSVKGQDAFDVSRVANTYTVVVKDSSRTELSRWYNSSSVGKNFASCGTSLPEDLGVLLGGVKLKFDVGLDNVVKKVSFTGNSGYKFTLNIKKVDKVDLKKPTISDPEAMKPGETNEQYIQRTRPFMYKHLQEMPDYSHIHYK